ncbi:HAD family hydrolase [Desulfonatronum thiodismutans]|uniref:HAD family hydrolase n=1 Tax=Desulfonatronum thiodismutans TaxID=159290 RepID=UPI0004ABE257|nr:HAD-IA family hydrolase [Desulfonatronum thiodismutans]
MSIRVIVFDYDGTLVFSNEIKRRAYWDIFQHEGVSHQLVAEVLADFPNGSRFDIIRNILVHHHKGALFAEQLESEVNRFAGAYDRIATEGAATCLERLGASEELNMLSQRYPLYLLSATLETSLKSIVQRRGWERFFRLVRGFPCEKADELLTIARLEQVDISSVLMVGDSDMDRDAASSAGARYCQFDDATPMSAVRARLGCQNEQ